MRMLADGRTLLRSRPEPTHLVVAHRSLLPAATVLAGEVAVCSVSVICHGSEMWGQRFRPRRGVERLLMRRRGVRTVAASGFTAGSLAGDVQATVLPPGLSQNWFEMLVDAADGVRDLSPGIQLATAFRLAAWREKGLRELIDAVSALNRHDVRLTICGSGEPPAEMMSLIADHGWCSLRAGLRGEDLARELAKADLFVLATRAAAHTVRGSVWC
jgi:glycosyltransferase involved in cell wall biosynthesis